MLQTSASPAVRVESVGSIGDVASSEWDRISAHANFFQSRPYLEAVELDESIAPRYFLARDAAGDLLGALPTYLWRGGPIFGEYDYFSLFVERMDESADRSRWCPALLLGGRAGYLNNLLLDEGVAHPRRVEVLRALVAAASDYAQDLGVRSMAFLYLRQPALAVLLEAIDDPALVLLTAAHARLDLPPAKEGFDGYLQSLSKSGRQTVRQDVRRFEESGLQMSLGRLGDWCERCGPLLANLQQRYGHDDDPDRMTEFLARRAATANERTRMFLCTSGRDLVGCSLFYASATGLYSGGCGFDYRLRADGTGAYFALVYYSPVEHALEARLPAVHLGLGSYEAKLIRGATLESLWSVILGSEAVQDARPHLADWNVACREIMEARFGRFRKAFANDTWISLPTFWPGDGSGTDDATPDRTG